MSRRAFAALGPLVAATTLAATLLAPGDTGAEAISGPRLDYVLQCRGCHLEDGSGAPGRVPSLLRVGRFLRVPGGREYLVRVPGAAHAPLDDAALAALLNWMLARFDPPAASSPGFVPYGAGEVGRLRAAPLADASAERRALLAALGGE